MKTLSQILNEDTQKENQLHQILLYPDEAQRQLEMFDKHTSDNFKNANPHLLKSKSHFSEIHKHASIIENPHKWPHEAVKDSLDYLGKVKHTLDTYHDYHKPDKSLDDWDNERTIVNHFEPLHDSNDPEAGGENDARSTYKGHIANAQKYIGRTGKVIDKGTVKVPSPTGKTIPEPAKVKVAVDTGNTLKSKADKYFSAQTDKMNKEKETSLPQDPISKAIRGSGGKPTDGAEEMDRLHVAWFKHDKPRLVHLSGDEAYPFYRAHMVNGAINFRDKKLAAPVPKPVKKRSLMDVLTGRNRKDDSDFRSKDSHVSDHGLHHFQELPKDVFVKHWDSK